ncbi:MAG: hypothetical protein WCI04_05470 [archaeon]
MDTLTKEFGQRRKIPLGNDTMNSIDAIISLCALTTAFALLLGTVNQIQKDSTEAHFSINAKISALNCAGIIDSIISNSANSYSDEIGCIPEGKIVKATINSKTKTASILGKARKNPLFEIEVKKHYIE